MKERNRKLNHIEVFQSIKFSLLIQYLVDHKENRRMKFGLPKVLKWFRRKLGYKENKTL